MRKPSGGVCLCEMRISVSVLLVLIRAEVNFGLWCRELHDVPLAVRTAHTLYRLTCKVDGFEEHDSAPGVYIFLRPRARFLRKSLNPTTARPAPHQQYNCTLVFSWNRRRTQQEHISP